MKEIKTGYTESDLFISKISISYCQPCDEFSGETQTLSLEINDNGAGAYIIMKTERWAVDSIDELIKVLSNFKEKAGI